LSTDSEPEESSKERNLATDRGDRFFGTAPKPAAAARQRRYRLAKITAASVLAHGCLLLAFGLVDEAPSVPAREIPVEPVTRAAREPIGGAGRSNAGSEPRASATAGDRGKSEARERGDVGSKNRGKARRAATVGNACTSGTRYAGSL
jgi:hypothetical protein